MAITDLTGTKWKLNNLPLSTNNYYDFDINFISNETNYTHLRVEYDQYYEFQLRYDGILVYDGGGGHSDPYWANEAYKKIEIIDGADVTDADLITKLQQWGVQPLTVTYTNVKPVTDPTYTYTSNFYSDEISYLDAQQDETKYYEYTLNFDTDGGTLGEYDPPRAAPQLYQFDDEYYIQDSGYWRAGYQYPIPANTFTQDITARAGWILTNIYYEDAYFTLPTCVKSEEYFKGWLYTNKLGVSKIYTAGSEFIPSENDDFTLNFTALFGYENFNYTPFDSNFIGFSLYSTRNQYILHSIIDLNIYRVSDGSRYNENLRPTFQDQTSTVQGGDGTYYFGTTFQNRQITLQIAFDNVSEAQRRKLISQMCDKTPKWLILDEMPYKKWLVVPNGSPSIKWVCFNQGPNRRIYKGEGTLQFISYNPYAISRFKYIDEYTLSEIPEWSRFFTIYPYEGSRSEEAYNEIETPLICNYDYLSTNYLGEPQYTICPFEIFQNIDTPVYYVDWGNKKEWQNIMVSLKTREEVEGSVGNDTNSIKGIYNPGDIPTEPIIKFQVGGLQGIYECVIDSVRMRFDASKIIEITNSDSSITKYIVDNKQHIFYAADAYGNLLYYLNDAIITGDFFMIDPMEEVNEFELNGANITNLEIDYKYLYY